MKNQGDQSTEMKGISDAGKRLGLESRNQRLLFSESIELIRLVEWRLRPGFFRRRWLWLSSGLTPLFLILRGLGSILSGFNLAPMAACVVGLLAIISSVIIPLDYQVFVKWIFYAILILLLLWFVFPPPSAHCSSGVNDKYVETVVRHFGHLDENSPKHADLIAKNVKLFAERVDKRIAFFRWALAAGWASVSPFTGELIKAVTAVPPRAIDIAPLLPSLILIAILYLILESYGRGVDIVFRTIELGCNEKAVQIDRGDRLEATLRSK